MAFFVKLIVICYLAFSTMIQVVDEIVLAIWINFSF